MTRWVRPTPRSHSCDRLTEETAEGTATFRGQKAKEMQIPTAPFDNEGSIDVILPSPYIVISLTINLQLIIYLNKNITNDRAFH